MRLSQFKSRDRGFSIVEIMVGLAIALLGVLVIMQVSIIFEGRKRTTTTGADTQTTGAVAFYSFERDLRRAGLGMSKEGSGVDERYALGCTLKRYYDGAALGNSMLLPVLITDGANGASDKIQIFASTKSNGSAPYRLRATHRTNEAQTYLETTLGVDVDDRLIMYQPGSDCVQFQVTGPVDADGHLDRSTGKLEHIRGAREGEGIWNPDDPTEIFSEDFRPSITQVFNMGKMIDHIYELDDNNNLLLVDAAAGTRAVAGGVVSMQAQYGFDKRATPVGAPQVTEWSSTMIDANSDGVVNDAGDIARIVAVRTVMVVRSSLMEKPNIDGVCDVTTSSPTWAGSAVAGGTIDLSKTDADWKCYRYKTFENVIPLRNLMWRT